jgi:hypothetical protein
MRHNQGVTKRCRLSWLTNSAFVYEQPNAGGDGGSCGVSANEYSCAFLSPNKLWRSNSIFNHDYDYDYDYDNDRSFHDQN